MLNIYDEFFYYFIWWIFLLLYMMNFFAIFHRGKKYFEFKKVSELKIFFELFFCCQQIYIKTLLIFLFLLISKFQSLTCFNEISPTTLVGVHGRNIYVKYIWWYFLYFIWWYFFYTLYDDIFFILYMMIFFYTLYDDFFYTLYDDIFLYFILYMMIFFLYFIWWYFFYTLYDDIFFCYHQIYIETLWNFLFLLIAKFQSLTCFDEISPTTLVGGYIHNIF